LEKTIKKSFLSCQGSRPIFRPWKKSFKQFNIFPDIHQMNYKMWVVCLSFFITMGWKVSIPCSSSKSSFFRFFEVESFEPVANCAQKCPPFFGIRWTTNFLSLVGLSPVMLYSYTSQKPHLDFSKYTRDKNKDWIL
jgi:hypothetical protein